MSLVTYARYLTVTGDTTTASATAVEALTEAQGLLEDELGRIGLLEDDDTDKVERLKVYNDRVLGFAVFPAGLPITDPLTYTEAGAMLVGASPDDSPFFPLAFEQGDRFATVTYRGGFTDETVPGYMARDLAWAAHAIAHQTSPSLVPAGAISASIGDASVTWDRAQVGGSTAVSWSRETLRHRRRRL